MHGVHIDNVDLNLLKALGVLLEERHVSRAAARFHLSQSAMSRTLARLRDTFGDELLVRTSNGYELTPRARAIQRELRFLLPRLQSLVRGGDFEPGAATDTVRVCCTDYVTTVLGPRLFQRIFRQAPHLSLTVEPLTQHTYDDVGHGRVDLAFSPVRPPTPLNWRTLFREDFVCVLAANHPVRRRRLTLDDLGSFPHASVVMLDRENMVVERLMHELDIHPPAGLRVPYFAAAVQALPGTTLIAALPRRFTQRYTDYPGVRMAEAPVELGDFDYGLIWHPRLDADPAQVWVRGLIQDYTETMDQT
jgi:DNA-binding transcriptional LysR family regulator